MYDFYLVLVACDFSASRRMAQDQYLHHVQPIIARGHCEVAETPRRIHMSATTDDWHLRHSDQAAKVDVSRSSYAGTPFSSLLSCFGLGARLLKRNLTKLDTSSCS